tara:strand:- start:3564 stop:4652 length:1089 start_codon:yes stop_codon:yes gene_type:complete
MAGGTGVPQITSPGQAMPGMQPTMGNFPINLPPNMQGQGFSYGPDIVSNSRLMPVFGNKQPNSVTNIPDAGVPDFIKAMGGTLADGDISADMQGQGQPGQPDPVNGVMPMAPMSGKGGTGGQPAMPTPAPSALSPAPPQGQYAPMAPQGQFNVNQASAGALQQALGTTQQAMQRPINIGAYANPFTSAVIERTQQDIGRQQEMASNQLGAQATAAKAFGGSRQGVAEGVMAGEYGRMAGDIAAQQRQANYSQALQAAMADRQARLGAASQLGGLGQQAFQTGQTIQGQQQQQGLLQQSIQQALIDAARQQYAGYTGAPNTALQAPLAALGIAQQGGAGTTTTSDQPGLLSYLQAASGFVKPR